MFQSIIEPFVGTSKEDQAKKSKLTASTFVPNKNMLHTVKPWPRHNILEHNNAKKPVDI